MDIKFLLTACFLLTLTSSACVTLDVLYGNTFVDAGDVEACCNSTHISFKVQLSGSFIFKLATQTIKIDILSASTTTYATIPGDFEYKYDATGNYYQVLIPKPDLDSSYLILFHIDIQNGATATRSQTAWVADDPVTECKSAPGKHCAFIIDCSDPCDINPTLPQCQNDPCDINPYLLECNCIKSETIFGFGSLELLAKRWGWQIELTQTDFEAEDFLYMGAGQNIISPSKIIGSYLVTLVGSAVEVEITLNAGVKIQELHVNAAVQRIDEKAAKIGHFTYKDEFDTPVTSIDDFVVPVQGTVLVTSTVYVSIHLVGCRI